MTEGFDILNSAIDDYIKSSNMIGEEDLILVSKLTDIILSNKEVYFDYKYDKKYSLKESDKIVKNFLSSLNPYYEEYYEMRKKDGTILFDHQPQTDESAFSSYDPIDNKRIIYIPLDNTLEDSFAIVHELMHDINLDISLINQTRFAYTEGLSLLGELLLEDYLKERNVKQYNNPTNKGLYSLKSKAIEVSLNLNLIKKYLIDGYINTANLLEILDLYPENYADDLSITIYKITDSKELTLDEEQRYIIGGLIATYMYDRIKSNKYNLMELFELNQMLKYYNFDQVLDYLDLDYNEIDLEPSAYKKLEEKYKKYLKSR